MHAGASNGALTNCAPPLWNTAGGHDGGCALCLRSTRRRGLCGGAPPGGGDRPDAICGRKAFVEEK